MSAFKRTQAPSRPVIAEPSDSDDSETATTTTSDDDDDDDDDDEQDSGKHPAFVRAAAPTQHPTAGSGSDEDETEGEQDEDEEHGTLSDEDEDETDEELSEGEPRAEPTSAANALEGARPQTPGEVSAELVELALEVVDGEDVSPVVRLAFERAAPQAVIDALETIISRKVNEAEEIVAQHYEEFVTAMGELRHVQEDAEDLTTAVRAHNDELHAAGKPQLELLQTLEGERLQACRLAAASTAVETCLAALQQCQGVVACVNAGQYYAALRLLERMRTERLPTLPCGALREYITSQLPAAEALVEERAKALLDLWLADAAAAARDIGRRAVAAAASSRAAVQARWDAQLVGVHSAAQPGGPLPAFSLRGAAAEDNEDPLEGLSLTRVATARHALACLGKEEAFWAHYAQRRASQLSDHLAAGEGAAASFLESYQSYFGAVAGFFVVEGHVVRAAGGAITAGQLAASWDRAAGALSTQLAAQLARIPSAGELLLVADYVRLLAAALQQLGLWTAALDAALHEAQERYHELAGAEALETLRRAASRDSLEPVTLHNAAEYAADVVALGLHPADSPLPDADDFPLLAPFTPLVPTMLRVLKAHTGDSCSFCGAAGEEGVRTVGRFRDALLQRIVDEVLAPQLTGSHPRGAASPLVQLAANAAALDAASAAQDAELAAACHVAEERAAALALAALASEGAMAAPRRLLRTFRERAEEALLAGLAAQVDAFFAGAPLDDWLPEAPRTMPREAAHAAAAFLEHALGEACTILLPATSARLCRAALGHTSDLLLAPLLRDDGRRFNVHALSGLEADVSLLEKMVAQLDVTGVHGAFAEPRQLCDLFTGDALEKLAGSECESSAAFRAALQRSYFALAPARLVQLLDRYREPPGPGLLHRSATAPTNAPKRKTVGIVLDRVRALMRPR